jgi:YHS domain-containing protein
MNRWKKCTVILMAVAFSVLLLAESIRASDKLAIKGYDAVAYFKDSRVIKGSESFPASWHGKTWYFSTRENRDLFAAGPEKYAPQYDGYCAWAMSENRIAITDPEVWKIFDGKLYLNCSQAAYEKWSKDIQGNIKRADVNWLKMRESKKYE